MSKKTSEDKLRNFQLSLAMYKIMFGAIIGLAIMAIMFPNERVTIETANFLPVLLIIFTGVLIMELSWNILSVFIKWRDKRNE
jgi:NADH:ubiquinone oxidoreductase subunit 2 (subunit N)